MKKLFRSLDKKRIMFQLNNLYNESSNFNKKNKLLRRLGIEIEDSSRVACPIHNTAKLKVGSNCWIGRNFNIEGNGEVIIEENCDIGPNVTILTGSHFIGDSTRRAGTGFNGKVVIHSGSWVCANCIILPNVEIGKGNIIGAGSIVKDSTPDNVLVCGCPAKVKKEYDKL